MDRGERIGPYRLVRQLGRGGFAEVWEATREDRPERCALKVLHERFVGQRPERGPSATDRFLEEAALLRGLRHQHVVTVHEVIDLRPERRVAYAMELLEGASLDEASQQMTLHQLTRCFSQVAGALAYLHGHGVIHRDVTLPNIFITESGDPKLLDLGVAKDTLERAGRDTTATGMMFGTLQSMAPEVLARTAGQKREVTAAADQWSLGVAMYTALCGRPPYAPAAFWILWTQLNTMPVPPLEVADRFRGHDESADLEDLVMRTLDKRPEGRFATMSDVQDRLAGIAMRLLPTQVSGLPTAAPARADTVRGAGSAASRFEMETMPAIPRMALDDEDL